MKFPNLFETRGTLTSGKTTTGMLGIKVTTQLRFLPFIKVVAGYELQPQTIAQFAAFYGFKLTQPGLEVELDPASNVKPASSAETPTNV